MFVLYITVPIPNVNITIQNSQIAGQGIAILQTPDNYEDFPLDVSQQEFVKNSQPVRALEVEAFQMIII